jgi:glycosyltransferase involved in cell wall biosynthesis
MLDRAICYCQMTSDFQGGSDFSILEVVKEISKTRRVFVFLRKGDPLRGEYERIGVPTFEVPFHAVPSKLLSIRVLLFLISFFATTTILWRYFAKLAKHHRLIVHVNTSTNIQAGLAAVFTRVPLVWHVREYGQGFKFRALIRCLGALADVVVANSQFVKNGLDSILSGRVQVFLAVNAVPEPPAKGTLEPRVSRGFKIVFPGRIEEWKGQELLVRAAIGNRREFLRYGITVDFYGNASRTKPEYLVKLKQLVNDSGLADVLNFYEFTDDLNDVIRNADLLINASISPEPFGRTVAEAMLVRTNVLVPNEGGVFEVIGYGKFGYSFEAREDESLGKAICNIAAMSDKERENAATQALGYAKDAFALPRLIFDLERVYAGLQSCRA